MQDWDGLGYAGKTVVVTGAASGMGEAAARILRGLGARVHIVDVQEPRIEHDSFRRCDLSDFAAARAVAEELAAEAPIDFLFCCAGIPPHVLGAMQCMKVNYLGNRHFVRHLLPSLRDGAGIAVISSDAALGWQKNLAQSLEMLAIDDPDEAVAWIERDPASRLRDGYTTSKEMLAVWVQREAPRLGLERRIRLNAIAPCPTRTAFMDRNFEKYGDRFLADWPYPSLGRMATAEEQAWPLVLLNSPLNAAVTGSFLYTDQGFASGVLTGAIDAAALMGGKAA